MSSSRFTMTFNNFTPMLYTLSFAINYSQIGLLKARCIQRLRSSVLLGADAL